MFEARSKRFTASLLTLLLVLSLIATFALRTGSPASAHSAVSSSHEIAVKKHHHRYLGVSPNPVQQNIDQPAFFTVTGKHLPPRSTFDIWTDLDDRCDIVILPGEAANDGFHDVVSDLEGRVSFPVLVTNCVEGKYHVCLTNDSPSAEQVCDSFKIKTP